MLLNIDSMQIIRTIFRKRFADHELAAILGCKEVFNRQGDRAKSCYFHYSQNIVKHISSCGLKIFWNEPQLMRFVRELQGEEIKKKKMMTNV